MSDEQISSEASKQITDQASEDILKQAFDSDLYSAVPEHNADLRTLSETYGDNIYDLPCIKRLGAAGIELLKKSIEAQNNPKKSETVNEMIARKKREVMNEGVKPDKLTSSPNSSTDPNDKSKTTITEQAFKTTYKPIERIQDITQIEEVLRSTVTEHEREKPVAIEIKTEQTKPEELPAVRDISVLKIKHEQPVSAVKQEELIITDDVLSENIDYRVEKTEVEVAEVVPVEIVPQIQIETITVEEKVIESVDEVLNQSIEEFSNFLSDIRHELGLEVAEVVPVEVVEIIELDDASFEAPILGITEVSGADLLEELDEPVSEVAATFESDLTQLIEALEPDKAEEVIDTLHLLVKAIRNETTETDQPELIIEELFAHLLELLDLEDQDELVKKLRIMLQLPELIDKTLTDQNLTIDQLNRLGTHEYKPTTLVSIFTSLISHVKELISAQLMLGKYAIRATLA